MSSGVIEYASPGPRRGSLLTIFLIVFIDLVGFGILLPNQQYYGETFGISNAFALTLIGPAYSLFQFLFAPILGTWSDRIGRRPVLIVSQVGTLAGFLILYGAHFVVAIDVPVAIFLLYFSRVLDGISGGNISTATAYVADVTTRANRAKGMGLIGAAFGLGFVFGPFIGGVVGKHLGLAYVPLAGAVFSAGALVMTVLRLPESHHPGEVTEGIRRFTVTGLQHALARPIIGAMIVMGFVNGFAFAGMEQTFSLLIQHRARLTAENASGASGYLFGGIGLIIVVVQGGLIGRLTKRFGEPRLVAAGPLLVAAGLVLVGADWGALGLAGVWRWLIVGSAFLAVGSSLFNPSLQSLISRHARQEEQGEILGAAQGMASLARGVGPLLAGFLYWWFAPEVPYFVAAAICLGVAVVVLARQRQLRPPA